MCLYASRCGFIFIWCHELKSDRQLLFGRLFGTCVVRLTAVLLTRPQSVQRVDSTIRWINHFPLDKLIDFYSTYPPFEQLGPGVLVQMVRGPARRYAVKGPFWHSWNTDRSTRLDLYKKPRYSSLVLTYFYLTILVLLIANNLTQSAAVIVDAYLVSGKQGGRIIYQNLTWLTVRRKDLRQAVFGSWIVFFNILISPFPFFNLTLQFFYFAFSQLPVVVCDHDY